jgi:hypothetical protein
MGQGLIVAPGLANQLMTATFGHGAVALPFARDILLIETWLAGVAYENRREALDKLDAGDRILLRRRPDNEHDEFAIEVHGPGGEMLGFVPRAKNEIPARLMDAGKLLVGRLQRTRERGRDEWRVELYLHDL